MDSINPAYAQMLPAIRQAYRQDRRFPTVALGQFLTPEAFGRTERELRSGWQRRAIPDRYDYGVHAPPSVRKEIAAFVRQVAGAGPVDEGTRRFGHRSYTLMHDEHGEKPGVVALLFLENWDEDWGGQVVFMKDGETLGRFTPSANTLLIAHRRRGVRSFVQYVNHRAGRRVLTIVG